MILVTQYQVAPPIIDTLEYHVGLPSQVFLITIPPNVCIVFVGSSIDQYHDVHHNRIL